MTEALKEELVRIQDRMLRKSWDDLISLLADDALVVAVSATARAEAGDLAAETIRDAYSQLPHDTLAMLAAVAVLLREDE